MRVTVASHHLGVTYVLPQVNPFNDWNASQRYAHQSQFDVARTTPHQTGANQVRQLIKSRIGGFDMTTFDQILPQVAEALRAHADRLPTIGPILINRDLNDQVRLVVSEPACNHPTAKQAIDAIACELARATRSPCLPCRKNAVLFEVDMDSVCAGATSFLLEGFEGVKVIDRLATEGNWASIAPESTGVPRIVFFSIKGGVGRSTALAASAWALAQAGQRVLVLDLDLESPGLSSALLPGRRPAYGIADWLGGRPSE